MGDESPIRIPLRSGFSKLEKEAVDDDAAWLRKLGAWRDSQPKMDGPVGLIGEENIG